MQEYTWTWIHTASSKSGVAKGTFESRLMFLEAINNWNRIGSGDWVYHEGTLMTNKLLQTSKKTKSYFGKEVIEHYELRDKGTHYCVLTLVDDDPHPKVINTGKAQYINKLWKEMTGKNACLK